MIKVVYDSNRGLYQIKDGGGIDFSSTHISTGHIRSSVTSVSGSYSILNESIVLADAVGGVVNITLPNASLYEGREITVKKIDITANAVNVLTFSSQTIDGESSVVISQQWTAIKVVAHDSNWYVI